MKITDKHIEPLPSSTVLLVRQGKAELEVLMMLRKKNTKTTILNEENFDEIETQLENNED